jgi:rhomboid protease GluP
MVWLAILLVGGFGVYVMRPEERTRALAKARRFAIAAHDAYYDRRPRRDDFRDALVARSGRPLVAASILLLNAVLFVLMLAGSGRLDDPATLIGWGGSDAPLTTNAQWWRLVSATFVHAGIVPFAVEMAALWTAGVLIEGIFGHAALAALYLAAALFAASIGLSATPLTVTTGASGVVFGMQGMLVALIVRGTLQRSAVKLPRRQLQRLAAPAVVFVLYEMWTGGPQWTAGLATFVIGFAIGLALSRQVAAAVPSVPRVLAVTATAMTIAMAIAAPLTGTIDIRPELARLTAAEERTAESYRLATEQFKLGAIKAEGLAQLIERKIIPDLQSVRRALPKPHVVLPQQQPLVAGADDYLRLRCDSWTLRAVALHQSSVRLLRDADQKERSSLDALERVKRAFQES